MNQENKIIPLFTSHYSFSKSILTLDKPDKLFTNKPISIFSIAKKYKLKNIYLCETNMGGFIEAFQNSEDAKISLRFGLKLTICDDINDKSDKSFKSEHKIIIWLKNTHNNAKSLNRIFTKAATDGFYYIPRIDSKNLLDLWDFDLSLSIPSYSSFLHNNLLKNSSCIPDLGKLKPTIFYNNCGLPFDDLIVNSHKNYAQNNNLELKEIQPIYYYRKSDFYNYLTFRCIHNKSTVSNPKIDNFSSKCFSFEDYCNKINIEFVNND